MAITHILVQAKGTGAVEAPVGDPYIGNTELLLKASEGFVELANGYNVNNTDVTISNTEYKFDLASYRFDSGSDKLNVDVPSTFYDYSVDDFTWEGFYYIEAIQPQELMGYRISAGDNLQLYCGYPSASSYSFLLNDTAIVQSTFVAGDLNKWIHLAVTKQGTTYRLFKDGIKVDEATFATVINKTATYCNFSSRKDSTNRVAIGYGDQYRITKGVARYTADFAPPTEPFIAR